MKRITMTLAIAPIFVISARGQVFQNLNFESAQNLTSADSYISVTDALPGWTAYGGSVALSNVYYASNNFSSFFTAVELEGGNLALSGDFSVGLSSGSSISQTGIVPAGAVVMYFDASFGPPNLEVSLGGQSLSYHALSNGPNGSILYSAYVPGDLNGQIETLTFGIQGSAQTVLDNIEFLPSSAPEPSEFALIWFGAIFVWRLASFSPKRKHISQRIEYPVR